MTVDMHRFAFLWLIYRRNKVFRVGPNISEKICSGRTNFRGVQIKFDRPHAEWVVPFYPVVLEVLQEMVPIVKCWSVTLQPPPSHPHKYQKKNFLDKMGHVHHSDFPGKGLKFHAMNFTGKPRHVEKLITIFQKLPQ